MTGRLIGRATRAFPLLLAAAMFVLSLAHHHPGTPEQTGSAPKPCGVCAAGGESVILQTPPSVARSVTWTALPYVPAPDTLAVASSPASSRAPPALTLL